MLLAIRRVAAETILVSGRWTVDGGRNALQSCDHAQKRSFSFEFGLNALERQSSLLEESLTCYAQTIHVPKRSGGMHSANFGTRNRAVGNSV